MTSVALHEPSAPQLREILNIIDADESWLSLAKPIHRLGWYLLLSILYKRTGNFTRSETCRKIAADLFTSDHFGTEEVEEIVVLFKDLAWVEFETDL